MGGLRGMTVADITLAAFTLCNSARVVAYLPQITKAATDQGGAQAISFTTWALFLLSNTSAVAYALVNKDDWTMAVVFLGNVLGCAAIILVALWKRARHRRREGPIAPMLPSEFTEESR
jgi:hypothetical protein